MKINHRLYGAFTLVELSIVLVIIGFLIGGVLAGKELIKSSVIRSQVAQIQQLSTAVNAFRTIYNCLPGDCGSASQFGLLQIGDGNGLIDNGAGVGNRIGSGEPYAVWGNLTNSTGQKINLIPGSYVYPNSAGCGFGGCTPCSGVLSQLTPYMPLAKIGRNNFIYAYSFNNINYFGITNFTYLCAGGFQYNTASGITVMEAKNIDDKMDDGKPETGKVLAANLASNSGPYWVGTGTASYDEDTSAKTPGTTTCFDNGNSAGVSQSYSTAQNGGEGINCALSFQFQ